MKKHPPPKWYHRRELYLVVGLVLGIVLMALPALLDISMGINSPIDQTFNVPPPSGTRLISSPLDVLLELVWLSLPALFITIAIYWVVTRRRRWAGSDEAVKWSRR